MIDWGEKLELKIAMLPDSPGCYLMKDSSGTIIYVGKAVNLKNRVRSYFRDTYHTPKVAAMISHIDDFEILLCETNLEALMLECNLIKLHKPYYNILLKDDKHYPYVRINLKENYPRLTLARKMERDGAKYFGPYIGASAVRQVIDTARDVFPIRNCKLVFPLKSGHRPCVNYEIGRCLAPCAGKCTEAEYWDMLDGVIAFLNGDYKSVISELKKKMAEAAETMQYEKAAIYRDKIRDVEGMTERQIAMRTDLSEQDIISLAQDGLDAMAQILYVRGGRMVGGDHFILPGEGGEEAGDVLAELVTRYYEDEHMIPRNVLIQTLPEGYAEELEQWLRNRRNAAVTVIVPQRGEKHDLILLGEKNARDALEKRNAGRRIREERTVGAAENLGRILGMDHYPRRIEGFDISNTQGVLSVAAMVVFIDGVAAKKEYRHFRIKTVEGPNDFASMKETLGRRFAHALQEQQERAEQGLPDEGGKFSELPDLILIDGGPQQLAYAQEAMHEFGLNIPMFGLAERFEEIWLPGRDEPICLDHHTPELQLLQRIRDEAHRFGITHHRDLRRANMTHSQLDDIPGIGPARRKALLKTFGSIKAIREADLETLKKTEGMNAPSAEAVYSFFHNEKNE